MKPIHLPGGRGRVPIAPLRPLFVPAATPSCGLRRRAGNKQVFPTPQPGPLAGAASPVPCLSLVACFYRDSAGRHGPVHLQKQGVRGSIGHRTACILLERGGKVKGGICASGVSTQSPRVAFSTPSSLSSGNGRRGVWRMAGWGAGAVRDARSYRPGKQAVTLFFGVVWGQGKSRKIQRKRRLAEGSLADTRLKTSTSPSLGRATWAGGGGGARPDTNLRRPSEGPRRSREARRRRAGVVGRLAKRAQRQPAGRHASRRPQARPLRASKRRGARRRAAGGVTRRGARTRGP